VVVREREEGRERAALSVVRRTDGTSYVIKLTKACTRYDRYGRWIRVAQSKYSDFLANTWYLHLQILQILGSPKAVFAVFAGTCKCSKYWSKYSH
jgi:hypothetical protein